MKKFLLTFLILVFGVGIASAKYKYAEHPNIIDKNKNQIYTGISVRSKKELDYSTHQTFLNGIYYYGITDWINIGFSFNYGFVDISQEIMGQEIIVEKRGLGDPGMEVQLYLLGNNKFDLSIHEKFYFPVGDKLFSNNTFASDTVLITKLKTNYFNIYTNIRYVKEGKFREKYQYLGFVVGIERRILKSWVCQVDYYVQNNEIFNTEEKNPGQFITLTNKFNVKRHTFYFKYILSINNFKQNRPYCIFGYSYDF